MKIRRLLLFSLLIVLSSVSLILAQGADCPAIIEEALTVAGDNCVNLGRNSACYGYNRVDATFIADLGENFFSRVADIAQLSQLQQIRTAAFNAETGEWGVAVLNVQANLPNTLPGQAVILMLVGDTELTNAVPPEEAAPINETSVAVQTVVAANLRSGPSTNNNIVRSVPPGITLLADAYNEDRTWLRVVYEGQPAWIARDLVDEPSEGMADLPIADETRYTPMQAFYFTTGIGEPTCNEPPSSLVIQGPCQTKVTFNANGTDFTIGSTIILRQIGPNEMQLIVVDGTAEFAGLTVGGGFTIFFNTDDEGNIIQNSFNGFRPITPKEIEQFKLLEELDFSDDECEDKTLNYPIRFPTQEEITIIQQALSGGGNAGNNPGGGTTSTCASLRLTSPLGQVSAQAVPFYWDVAEGATRYDVRIYNANGQIVTSASTTSTSATLDPRAAGGSMYWEVVAYDGDTVLCTATSGIVEISGFVPTGPFSVNWYCDGLDLIVSWQNADPGDTVQIVVYYYSTPYTYSGAGTEGSVRIFRDDAIWYGGNVTTSSGLSATLSGEKFCYPN